MFLLQCSSSMWSDWDEAVWTTESGSLWSLTFNPREESMLMIILDIETRLDDVSWLLSSLKLNSFRRTFSPGLKGWMVVVVVSRTRLVETLLPYHLSMSMQSCRREGVDWSFYISIQMCEISYQSYSSVGHRNEDTRATPVRDFW